MTHETLSCFFETLTAETPLSAFTGIYAQNVYFKDPFHENSGVESIHQLFMDMYLNLHDPGFEIVEYVDQKNIIYVKWNFIFAFKPGGKIQSFEGVSRIELDSKEKIISHVDYWDAGEHIYAKLPILGPLIRYAKRKIGSE